MKKSVVYMVLLSLMFCIPSVYAGRVGYVSTRPATAVEITPEENLFSINGSSLKFILLDCDDEGLFCTTKEFYGTYPFDLDGTGKFDIEDENNIAYWLNTEFMEKGGEIWNNSKRDDKFPFPELIKEYLIERDWLCEAGHASTDYSEDYTVRAKLALMSVTEWKKYNDKIGYADNLDTALYYWLRSVNGTIEPGTAAPVMVVSPGGTAQFGKVRNGYGIRPVFYLKKEFFTEVKTDVTTLGDNVKKVLRENYTKEELKQIYNGEEIQSIYKNLPPQANTIVVSGVPQTGKVLKASYKFYSPEGEQEGESEYRWLRAKDKEGPYSIISGENSTEFKIRDIDEGYYFVFEIVPKTTNSIGMAVRSKSTAQPAAKDILCIAKNVGIDGAPAVGERLIARYSYYDENKDVEDGTLIRWQVSEDGTEFSDIPGAIGLNYVIPTDFEGKYIRFTINVKSIGADSYGETVISEAIGPIEYNANDIDIISIFDNGVARILSPLVSGMDIPFWTVYSENGELLSVEAGEKEYVPSGDGAFVQAGVFRTGNKTLGRIVYSDKLEIAKKQSPILKDTITVNTDKTVYLKSMGNEYAHSVEIHLECDGVKIEKAESDVYDSFVTDGEIVKIILVGKENSQINLPENVLKLDVSGEGTVKILETKGVYEFDNKIVDNIPGIYFE